MRKLAFEGDGEVGEPVPPSLSSPPGSSGAVSSGSDSVSLPPPPQPTNATGPIKAKAKDICLKFFLIEFPFSTWIPNPYDVAKIRKTDIELRKSFASDVRVSMTGK
jgi:hypothetical protein